MIHNARTQQIPRLINAITEITNCVVAREEMVDNNGLMDLNKNDKNTAKTLARFRFCQH